jgi:ABC-2 type transport system ATP-binding protein
MIESDKLVKDYGRLRAVDHVTFTVKKGDVLGFLGPNGAGKSTTMKMITGFVAPSSGTARIGGHDIREKPVEAKRLLGYLPENGPLYPEMTVAEFLLFMADMRGLDRASVTPKALDRVFEICHLDTVRHAPIETLSKGFRQRVGMAQAILHDPPCLIMDEPTDGLDPNQKREVRKVIASMAAEKAIVLSTHILEEVEAMCSRVVIIAGGRILVDETPAALRKRHPHYGCAVLKAKPGEEESVTKAARQVEGVAEVSALNGSAAFLVRPRGDASIRAALWEAARRGQWAIDSIEDAPLPLDEVFARLTKSQAS